MTGLFIAVLALPLVVAALAQDGRPHFSSLHAWTGLLLLVVGGVQCLVASKRPDAEARPVPVKRVVSAVCSRNHVVRKAIMMGTMGLDGAWRGRDWGVCENPEARRPQRPLRPVSPVRGWG